MSVMPDLRSPPRVLVAGVGNIFCSDDGFGPEVARRLAARALPSGVTVIDYGIRGMHLAYDLLAGWDRLILIDLIQRVGAPGSVHIVEVDPATVGADAPDPHGMAPHSVLAALGSMGGQLPATIVVGCVPADIGDGIGLSAVVQAAVTPAVETVLQMVTAAAPPAAAAGRPPHAGMPQHAGPPPHAAPPATTTGRP